MTQFDPTRPPRHLDDDWLYANPLAMGPAGSDDEQHQGWQPARLAGRRCRLRTWHLLGASTAGAALGLVLATALDLPRASQVARGGTSAICSEQDEMPAGFPPDRASRG